MASVTLQHLGKTYPNGHEAVRDLCLEVADGELVVLVGPSGCGKTTTLRLIAGLETVTTGDIHFGGQSVARLSPADRDVAMVFQEDALYPHLSVRRNMAFGLKMRRVENAEIENRVARAAELLGIAPLLDRYPSVLSGGERQRVALGRAMVRQPRVFLFDEPLSHLDARLRARMRMELAQLHRQLGATMLLVTHDQDEAMALGDRLVLLGEGRTRQIATPREVYQRPANRFVATFIGNPPMNLLEGEVRGGAFRLSGDGASPLSLDIVPAVTQQPILLGVRPEDLWINSAGIPLGTGDVWAVEPMGHELHAHLRIAGQPCIARIDPSCAIAAGDTIPVSIPRDRIHLFAGDAEGRRLA